MMILILVEQKLWIINLWGISKRQKRHFAVYAYKTAVMVLYHVNTASIHNVLTAG